MATISVSSNDLTIDWVASLYFNNNIWAPPIVNAYDRILDPLIKFLLGRCFLMTYLFVFAAKQDCS